MLDPKKPITFQAKHPYVIIGEGYPPRRFSSLKAAASSVFKSKQVLSVQDETDGAHYERATLKRMFPQLI